MKLNFVKGLAFDKEMKMVRKKAPRIGSSYGVDVQLIFVQEKAIIVFDGK